MLLFYKRDFNGAKEKLEEVLTLLPNDFNAKNILDRATIYTQSPPPQAWDGVEVMKTK
jgi:hypothetical protein